MVPPSAAAVGTTRLSSLYVEPSRWQAMTYKIARTPEMQTHSSAQIKCTIYQSLSYFVMPRKPDPDTSIQVFEKIAHAVTVNTM